MLVVASGISSDPEPERAADAVAREVACGLGGRRAEGAVFFATSVHGPGFGRIERALAAATGSRNVIGCSAVGVLGGSVEIERGPGLAAIALAGDLEVRRFFFPGLRGRADEVGRQVGSVVRELEGDDPSIVLLADSYNLAPDELLAGIDAVAPGVSVVGGGATEDGTAGETTVVARGVAAANAVAGFAFTGVRLRAAVSPSCTICSPWWTITEARGTRVHALDGAPALPTILGRLPRTVAEDVRQVLRSTQVALATPASPDDIAAPYLVRPLVGADVEHGAVLVGDEVLPGMRLALAVRDPVAARERLDANLERFVTEGAKTRGALYFNGVERGEALYGIAELEGAYLRHRLGDMAVAGLYCGAGFAPLGGRNRFHQHAGILVGLEAS